MSSTDEPPRRRWLRHKRIGAKYSHRLYMLPRLMLCAYTGSDNRSAGLHDHPWPFWSIRLWGRLSELTVNPTPNRFEPNGWRRVAERENWIRQRLPLVYRRRAAHAHAVVLESRFALTLVIHGRARRAWGFYTRVGWINHEHVKTRGPGGPMAVEARGSDGEKPKPDS